MLLTPFVAFVLVNRQHVKSIDHYTAELGRGVLVHALVREQPDPQATQPDNTRANKADRQTSEPTADQAKNNHSDRETMAKIRKAIMRDKSLSSDAHNVKVVAQNGAVTLSGPVHSEQEKKAVEEKAAAVAGRDNVTNQITVKNNAERSQ